MSNTPITDDVLFRGKILIFSLMFESLTSYFIARLVGIEDHENSKTLGNKSSSLSFNQRVDFLLDLKVLGSDQRVKLQSFMEIRNQLMHNIAASSYEKCFGFMNGKDKWLLKTYPQPNEIAREEKLEKASQLLAQEVFDIVTGLVKPISEKEEKEREVPYLKRQIDARDKAISEIENIFNDVVVKRKSETNNVKIAISGKIGKDVQDAVIERIDFHLIQELERLTGEKKGRT